MKSNHPRRFTHSLPTWASKIFPLVYMSIAVVLLIKILCLLCVENNLQRPEIITVLLIVSIACIALVWNLISLLLVNLAFLAVIPERIQIVCAWLVTHMGTSHARTLLIKKGSTCMIGTGIVFACPSLVQAEALHSPDTRMSNSASVSVNTQSTPDIPTLDAKSKFGRDIPQESSALFPSSPKDDLAWGTESIDPLKVRHIVLPPSDSPHKSRSHATSSIHANTGTPTQNFIHTKRSHTVQEGESLWSIAATQLGNRANNSNISELWPRIYTMNSSVIGPNPNIIRSTTILHLPEED